MFSLFLVYAQSTLTKDTRPPSKATQSRLELVKQATTATGGFNWDLVGGKQQGFNLNHLPALSALLQ